MIVEIALTSMIICLSKEMYELSLVCLALVCVFGLIRLHRETGYFNEVEDKLC